MLDTKEKTNTYIEHKKKVLLKEDDFNFKKEKEECLNFYAMYHE
jgi:hypothetical protein